MCGAAERQSACLAVAAVDVDADQRLVERGVGGLHQVVIGMFRILQQVQPLYSVYRITNGTCRSALMAFATLGNNVRVQSLSGEAWACPVRAFATNSSRVRRFLGSGSWKPWHALVTNSNSVRRISGEGAVATYNSVRNCLTQV